MAPKKQKPKGSNQAESTKGSKAGSNRAARGSAQVTLSSENEVRLRRLLQNTGGLNASVPQVQESLTEGQRKQAGKRLKNIYDNLIAEGFSSSQIELALAALPVGGATLEGALDWLCLNLSPNDLPSKFSSGVHTAASEGVTNYPNLLHYMKDSMVTWECWQLVTPMRNQGGSAQVLAVARPNWTPTEKPADAEISKPVTLIQSVRQPKKPERDVQAEQADWIKRYMAQQAEEDSDDDDDGESDDDSGWEVWADPSEQQRRKEKRVVVDPATRAQTAIAEFQAAKHAAASAKEKGDKQKQGSAGRLIRELKEELNLLGKSANSCNIERSGGQNMTSQSITAGIAEHVYNAPQPGKTRSYADAALNQNHNAPTRWDEDELTGTCTDDFVSNEPSSQYPQEESYVQNGALASFETEKASKEDTGASNAKSFETTDKSKENTADLVEDEGILSMFDEEGLPDQILPDSVVQLQKREKVTAWGMYGDSPSGRQAPTNKKSSRTLPQEELPKLPKAVLQQHCQKNGWPSPKYEKFPGRLSQFCYSVIVVQPTTGRGKSRKVGGPVTIKLPEEDDQFKSIAEAQNAVAARALIWLFPDLPLYRILLEPYRTMCIQWQAEGQHAKKLEAAEEVGRRTAFVDSLLKSSKSKDAMQDIATKFTDIPVDELTVEGGTQSDGKLLHEKQKDDRHRVQKEAESRHLLHRREQKLQNPQYQAMLEARAALPMAAVKDQLLAKVMESEVVVVGGETGCGKTTQVPQYILDEMIAAGQGGFCNIVCTQPRRIAATSVAERVAVERCEPAPGRNGSLVGYQVRLDTAWNQGTKLLFCTTGILLRRLSGDRDLSDISHIVVDEVHERTVLGDFLLVILKDLLERRRASGSPLKLILMSATLDSNLFSEYFGKCPVISAKGRTFSVSTYFLEDVYQELGEYRLATDSPAAVGNMYKGHKKKVAKRVVASSRGRQDLVHSGWGDESKLEEELVNPLYDIELYRKYSERTRSNLEKLNEDVIDYDLLEDLIIHIDEDAEPGAVLVFLPGMAEIQLLWERLSVSRRFSGSASQWLLPLHSSVASADQRRVFQSPPKGIRKIVLATNIAETSITIDDVVHVIDCGKHKENRFDPRRGMSSMVEAWISQANARQRSGRAGRVRSGNCFCLFTRHRLEKLMRPFQLPEILRVPLVELCLQIKLLRLGSVASFLERALEPPKMDAVASAMSTLREVGAVNEEEEITALGYHLAALPVDVRIGKMMVYGSVFGCVSTVLTVAACLSHKSPFVVPQDQREAAERAKQTLVAEKTKEGLPTNIATAQQSDHLALVAAYNTWTTLSSQRGAKAAREFCHTNFLSIPTLNMLRDMRMQFANLLEDIGFLTFPQLHEARAEARRGGNMGKWVDDLQQPFNLNSEQPSVVKASICAGLYPNVAAMHEDSVRAGHASALSRRAGLSSGQRPQWSDGRREVFVHPSSINHMVSEFRQPFLVFHEKVETSKVYLRDTTVISPYALLLFGGAIIVQHQTGRVTVDGWLEMNAPAQTAVLFKELRGALDSVLQERIGMPQGSISELAKELIPSITRLLIDEEKPQP